LRRILVKERAAQQTVSTWPAAALVISNMIGIGIFTSLGFQLAAFTRPDGGSLLAGGVFPIMMLWLVGGLLALCGALCYAELATALPRSGGEYHFLSRIYHPAVGFCTGFCSITVGFAAPIAVSAVFFGDYLCRAFPQLVLVPPVNFLSPQPSITDSAKILGEARLHTAHLIGLVLVTVALAAHLRSIRFSAGFQAMTTAVTAMLILAFVTCGAAAPAQPVSFLPHAGDGALILSASFGSSLIWVMYSYSGWNAAAYIAGEVRDPGKSLPRALILGTSFVVLLYAAITAAFLHATPIGALSGQPDVADIAGTRIFGPTGARIGNALICVGLIANVSAMMWIGSRVSQAIGSNYRILSLFARTTPRGVPAASLVLQYLITATLLLFDPARIVTYVESVLFFWSLLAVIGVIVLRVREPALPRPYRTWGYPVTPVAFAIVAVFCLKQTCERHPVETTVGALTVLAGLPLYWYASRATPGAAPLRGTMPGQIL
jgi:APA family basic amino acid/polyamine antiporter